MLTDCEYSPIDKYIFFVDLKPALGTLQGASSINESHAFCTVCMLSPAYDFRFAVGGVVGM